MAQPDPVTTEPRLVLVRHGQTEWARLGRYTSRTEQELTPLGECQAAALRGPLATWSFSLVLTSPRVRARRTCELAGYAAQAVVDPDLAEWDYGDDEGLTRAEMSADRPGWSIWRDGVRGGERVSQVGVRTERVIDRVLGAGGDVLAFSHGHLGRVLAARWLGIHPDMGRIFALDPATASVLGWHDGRRVVQTWNVSPEMA
jgi:broad specificity phosphatase PhoE